MYYKELLAVRTGLIQLALALAALLAITFGIAAANGVLGAPLRPSEGIPLPALFAMAGFVGAIFASRYACVLSSENESHLPVALTKPISRAGYALSSFAVDLMGVAAAFGISMVAIVIALAGFRAFPFLILTGDWALQLVRFVFFGFAFYGVMAALTASTGKAGRGIIGWTWVASFLVTALIGAGLPAPWPAMLRIIQFFNPLAYASYTYASGRHGVTVIGSSAGPFMDVPVGVACAALIALTVGGVALAVWLWQRVEA